MHKRAGELDEPFVEIAVWPVSIGEPEFLKHVVGFVVELAVEALEVTEIMRVERPATQSFN